mgnify:FL=1
MSIEEVRQTIKDHLYIIFGEKFKNDSNNTFIERYVAKHPLLKPELIVVNDQLHGFKKASKKVSSLEDFPIFLEMEGMSHDEESCYIDSIDVYAEANINSQKRLSDVIYVSKLYEQYIDLERVIDFSDVNNESIVITSKIQEYLLELSIDEDMEEDEMFMEIEVFNEILTKHLTMFCHIIQVLNDIIVKDIALEKIEKTTGYFPEGY